MTRDGRRIGVDLMHCAWWLAGWAALGFGSGLVLGLWLYGWRP